MIRARVRGLIGVVALLAALGACADAAPGPARLRLGLDASVCFDYCAETVRATLYREGDLLPIGPSSSAPCGQDLVIDDLPAGHRLYARVDVLGVAGEPLLTGSSDVVTVAANASVDAPVSLAALVVPQIAAATPDPVVRAADDVTLTLTGSGFAQPGGAYGVELDGVTLPTSAWDDATVVATLRSDDVGADLLVRRCGVASEPLPIRIVARGGPASAAVPLPPSCAGRRFVALAPDGDAALAAVACDDPALGYLQRLTTAGACPLAVAEYWPLGDNPVALAAASGTAWVALASGATVAVDVAAGSASAPPTPRTLLPGVSATALVAAPGPRVFAIGADAAGTALYELDVATGVGTPVPGADTGLTLSDLAVGTERVYAAATTGAVGKLVGVPLGGATVTEWNLTDCIHPVRVAAGDAGWVALACAESDDARSVGFRLADGKDFPIAWQAGGGPTAVVLDGVGDVALSLAPGGAELVAFDASGATELTTWGPVGAGPALRLAATHQFLVSSSDGSGLAVIAPYAEGALCDAP